MSAENLDHEDLLHNEDEDNSFWDLADVDPGLAIADGMDQSEVDTGIPQATYDREMAIATMKGIVPNPLDLSHYRRLYNNRSVSERYNISIALRTMGTPQRVRINRGYVIPSNSSNLAYSAVASHIDALMVVPKDIGLDAVLPITRPCQGYIFKLNFSQRTRIFKGRSPKFGFDPTESLLWIGRCRRDEVWVALADTLPGDAPEDTQPFYGSLKDAVMPVETYNMLLMFLAYSLSESGISDITVSARNRYPDKIEETGTVRRATNLL